MQAARHRGHLASAECTGTVAPGAYRTLKCPTRRAPTTLRTARRLPGHRGNNYFNCEPMLRAPRRSEDDPDEGRSEKKGHRLADACVAEPCPPLVNHHSATRCPHPPLSACAMTRARAVARRRHRIED
ncbi:hypothetical protein EVAR_35530_1 [Eumeta japonica]|uniref:Uncharacterized protein n=1 Tax=Eumeta variegata TaxID=151549 RepID=A0A4C1X4U7_EUMVA|nr:hypothetical protein EVAR_35530_1 [Eumeta japonica]